MAADTSFAGRSPRSNVAVLGRVDWLAVVVALLEALGRGTFLTACSLGAGLEIDLVVKRRRPGALYLQEGFFGLPIGSPFFRSGW